MNKLYKIGILLCIVFLLNGCYNYHEINDYAIVSGLSIDKSNKDSSKYTVGLQIMNAKKDEESDNSSIAFYQGSGNTIYETLEKITLDSPKEIYLGHNEVVVISEDLLKEEDPLNYLDYFMRDPQIEKDSLVLVSKEDKALDVLKIITPLETIPTKNLSSTLKIGNKFSGILNIVTIDEFISKLTNEGEQPIIPSVTIDGSVKKGQKNDNITKSDPEARLKLGPMAYFKNNKLKDYLTKEESVGYNLLTNNQNRAYIDVKCDDNNYALVRVNKAKIKENLLFKHGNPYVDFTTNLSVDLIEYNCPINFIEDEDKLKKLESKLNNKVKKLLNKTANKLYKENKADALEYGKKFYQKKYSEMKKLKYNRKTIINDISFNFKANVKIESVNLSIKSVKEKNNEQ